MTPEYLSFSLSSDFVNSFADREAPFGFPIGGGNTLGELTVINKYARRNSNGTKERWHQICQRAIEGMYSILKDHCVKNRTPWNERKARLSAEDAYTRMWSFKWLPPGRGLWMMGTPFVHLNNNSAALQNCFTGDTKFITYEGVRTLADAVGEDVEVWTGPGWAKATINSFGEREVQRITFAPYNTRSNVRFEVTATPDHKWILKDRGETTSLKVGDVVPAEAPPSDINFEGFIHGLIFGDGSINHVYVNGDFSHMMRLCGEKAKYADYFDNVQYQPNCMGDPVVYHRSSTNMKALPSVSTPEYIAGFVLGWLETDGTRNHPLSRTITTQDAAAGDWLVQHAAAAGWIVVGDNYDPVMETNYGTRSAPLRRITLKKPAGCFWTVKAIEALEEKAQTFCATVPDFGVFTLANGIYTGNCAFISTEKITSKSVQEAILPFIRLMEMSMLGVGVGFDTKGAGKITLNEPELREDLFVIDDSREGWYQSVGALLESYFFENRATMAFDYKKIRPAGDPILGFGGVAAGPGPLKELHNNLRNLLSDRKGQKVSSADLVDICNMIGRCVVAGNVRRSALLALGDDEDETFLNLKDWNLNPERMAQGTGWGHTSNNSAEAAVGTDYSYLAERIVNNGEPGLIYTDLCREYGRLIDPPTSRDYRVAGCNPCAEQSLESYELCTLVETFPVNCTGLDDWKRTLKYAYLYGKAVTLLPTHWPESNEVMQRNRRIGCSVSGQAQFVEQYGVMELKEWLNAGYKAITERDLQYSEWLGVRESIKKTSVKPSGTVSLVAGVTPGVHWPVGKGRYLRRVRYSVGDPTVAILVAAGYHAEPDVMDPDHDVVVTFPVEGPEIRSERDVSLWEKMYLAVHHQRYWADNMVSLTATFREDERDQVPAVLRAFDGQLKSIAMLPLGGGGFYKQLPYEQVEDAVWEEHANQIVPIDMEALYRNGSEALGERYCDSDVCEMKSWKAVDLTEEMEVNVT